MVMVRPVRLRARAAALTFAAGVLSVTAQAEMTEKNAPATKPADPNFKLVAPPKSGEVQNPLSQTPAQKRYGMPRNPLIGAPVDTDLSKPLTLDRAIRIGLQQQNTIAISKAQSDAASARLIQARSSYYPQVTPSFRWNYNLQPGGIFIINGNPIRGNQVSEARNSGINASYLIWDTGRREANVGQSRRNAFAAEYSLGDERQSVIFQVTQSYYNLLRNRALVRVQEENVRRAETTLESIRAQVEVGNAARSDTFQAESDLANAQVALLQAQNDFVVAQASLKNAMGLVSPEPIQLPEGQVPIPKTDPDPIGLEEYVREAYQNRLDVKQQQELVNAQGYSVKLAHLDNGINIQATVSEGFQIQPNEGETRSLFFSVSYPLFDGFASREAVRESKAQLEVQRRNLDLLQQNVRLNVEQSYLVREQSRRQILSAQKAVEAGQVNYNAALERQRNGLINILEVITAQVQLVNAQQQLVQAVYDFYIAEASLARNIGLNDPSYVPRVPGAKPVQFRPELIPTGAYQSVPLVTPAPPNGPQNSPGAEERKP